MSVDLSQPVSPAVNGASVSNIQVKCSEVTHTISGVAKSGGQPLSNKTVIINDQGGFYGGYWGFSDQNGNFTIDGIPNGIYTILIGGDIQTPILLHWHPELSLYLEPMLLE